MLLFPYLCNAPRLTTAVIYLIAYKLEGRVYLIAYLSSRVVTLNEEMLS